MILRRYKPLSKRIALVVTSVCMMIASVALLYPRTAVAAPCTPPGTDYGTVTYSATVSTAGTYRIWVRMAAPDTSTNTVFLEIDGNTCLTVGGSTVPVYAGGTSTHFANNTSNWINRTSGGATISHSFTTGSHSFKLIGTGAGVVVDRVLVVTDDSCTPTGTGDNCAMIYLAPDIDTNGVVNFLDFSALASRYGQSGGSLGRSDINRDDIVNFLDYSLLASKYGQ